MENIKVKSFDEISENEMSEVNGGSTKLAAGICGIASGVCCMVAGIASATGHSKVSNVATILSGACGTAAGVLALFPAV